MRHRTGTWPLWQCVTRITVSQHAPARLVNYVGSWLLTGQRPAPVDNEVYGRGE